MNTLKLGILGLFGVTTLAIAQPEITCKSIDVTFLPSYFVEISQFDVTHPRYFGVKIVETVALGGAPKRVLRKEGGGKITAKGFYVDFADGSGKIEGKALSGIHFRGELRLGEKVEELSCRYN